MTTLLAPPIIDLTSIPSLSKTETTPPRNKAKRTFDPALKPFRVLAFGAGVQTIALLELWVFDGSGQWGQEEHPGWHQEFLDNHFGGTLPDLCIFADTGSEPDEVYAAVEEAKCVCADANVPFRVVKHGDLARPPKTKTGKQKIFTPVYTIKLETDAKGPAGKLGQLERQCTQEYKIRPMTRVAKQLAGKRPIEITLGISLDEWHRMHINGPDDRIQLAYPLVTDPITPMTRQDCLNHLRDIEVKASKSACVFCPYRRDPWWAHMYRNDPKAYAAAVAYDEWVRHQRPGYLCYVHDSRRPLADVVPEIVAEEETQFVLFPMHLDMSSSGGCESGYC